MKDTTNELKNEQRFQRHKKSAIAAVLVVISIVILPLIKDVILYEYEKNRDEKGTSDQKVDTETLGENERSHKVTEIMVEDNTTILVDSIHHLEERWVKSFDELSDIYLNDFKTRNEELETFAYLEGNKPENSYGVFLESYYGISNRAEMGKILVDSLVDREINWALKLQKVHVTDESKKGIVVVLSPIRPVCEEGDCPEGFNDELLLSLCNCDATTKFLQDIREGDYVFFEGKGRLLETEDIDYRQRFSPLITKYTYRPNES